MQVQVVKAYVFELLIEDPRALWLLKQPQQVAERCSCSELIKARCQSRGRNASAGLYAGQTTSEPGLQFRASHFWRDFDRLSMLEADPQDSDESGDPVQ